MPTLSRCGAAALVLSAVSTPLRAEGEWNPDTTFPALPPAEAIKTIEVPAGFHLQCVASEPMVEEPAMIAFDGNGALYVCEWRTYMQDEHATGQLDPVSRVVKLTDTDGDGTMDRRTVFIDNVILPRTVLPMHDRVLVNFTEDQTIWAYFDDNRDGVADRREVAWQGAPDHGNIEHQQSGMLWNLDNTICTNDRRFLWNSGTLEARPHSRGRISQWGLARDDDGRLIASWGGGANPAQSGWRRTDELADVVGHLGGGHGAVARGGLRRLLHLLLHLPRHVRPRHDRPREDARRDRPAGPWHPALQPGNAGWPGRGRTVMGR